MLIDSVVWAQYINVADRRPRRQLLSYAGALSPSVNLLMPVGISNFSEV